MTYPKYEEPKDYLINKEMLMAPSENGRRKELVKGPNISTMPEFDEPTDFEVPVLLKMGDNISTDEILRAGAEVLPFRSNIPEISKFSFTVIDENFYERSIEAKEKHGGHVVVAGENYAQGSSREHAAIAPRYLGQKSVIAKSYARIGWQNLANFGIIPLEFSNDDDFDGIDQGDRIKIENVQEQIKSGSDIIVTNTTKGTTFKTYHTLSGRQLQSLLDGSVINTYKKKNV